jgi:NADH dehydrogenase
LADRKHVVIVGGGFGGLKVAKGLRRSPVRITLVDRRNHHLFQPLLYQVATAALAPGDIAEPIRHILSAQDNVEVRLDDALSVDVAAKVLKMKGGEIAYDYLVLAAGATHSYFGHDDWSKHAQGLKNVGDALELRRRMLIAFERAEWTDDPVERKRLMTFAIVGAGPTGVEMAGAIAEIASHTMLQDFRHIDTRQTRVVIVEAQPKVLNGYPEDLQERARQQLVALGVELKMGAKVTAIDEKGLTIDGADRIDSATMIWAAGVQGEPIAKTLGVELDRAGRVKVLPDLSIAGHPEVFVIGDLAFIEQDGKPLPGVAQVAMQSGVCAASNIRADLDKTARTPFRYKNLGMLATIGKRRAVAALPAVHLWGFPAWFTWVFIHLVFLIAFRSRLVVFWKWAISYLTSDRGSRLVWQTEGWELERRD